MSVNGVANRAPVRGAASSFPAPSPPALLPFQRHIGPTDTPKGCTKSLGAVFQRGSPMAMQFLHAPPAPCATKTGGKDKTKPLSAKAPV